MKLGLLDIDDEEDGRVTNRTMGEILSDLSDSISRLQRGEITSAEANAVSREAGADLASMKAAMRSARQLRKASRKLA